MDSKKNKSRTDNKGKYVKTSKKVTSTPVQEIKWDAEQLFSENKYYSGIAKKFKICKLVTAVLILVFTVTMLSAFSTDITSENFQYLIKDLDITGLTSDGDFSSIVFNGGNDSRFGMYRGELAIINAGSTTLYNTNGALSFSKNNTFYKPKLLTSDKYMLVYDSGNTSNSFSIYNSFAELSLVGNKNKLDYPITSAALADSGDFALVTRNDSYKGVVLFYDADFRLVNEVKKDKYIVSVDLTPNGDTLAVAAMYDKDGSYVSEITTVKKGDDKVFSKTELVGTAPMSVKFLKNGNIAVQYIDRIVIYNADMQALKTVETGSLLSVRTNIGQELITVVNNNTLIGNDKTVNIFNAEGETVYTGNTSGELIKASSFEKKSYLVFEDSVMMIDTVTDTVKTADSNPNPMDIVYSSLGMPIICYADSASPVYFDGANG